MFLSDLSIKKPILVSVIYIVFIFFGILAYFGLPLNIMPVVNMPFVTIQTIYPGAGANEVELQITNKIEDAISTVSRIQKVESNSIENVSFVTIRFEIGKNPDIANQEVKDKVDQILNDLPEDAKKPIITKFDPSVEPVMDLIFSGNLPVVELFNYADNQLNDRFSQIDGVAKVSLSGGSEREIIIKMDASDVFLYKISPIELSLILKRQNIDMPAGGVDVKDQEYSSRLIGKYNKIEQISTLQIPTTAGYKRLSQLASVADGNSKITKKATYYDVQSNKRQENVIRLSLVKTSEGNAVNISKQVDKIMPEIINSLPAGTSLVIVSDDSDFVENSVNDTIYTILLGVLFTGIVLFLFLADLRSTLIVSVSMPVSIISTMTLISAFGFSLNILSLMGLSASIGVLVANSVVVIENIFRHIKKGENRKDAAAKGTAEIALAVIASTMTNLVVFIPIANMSSIAGQFFKEFAMTVVFATIFSLLISFMITPMLASLILPTKLNRSKFAKFSDFIFQKINRGYHKLLTIVLKNKLFSLGVILFSLVILFISFSLGKNIGFEFVPFSDGGNIQIKVEMPQGYNLNETAKKVKEIEDIVGKNHQVKEILTTIGEAGDFAQTQNRAKINIQLVDSDKRDVSTKDFASLLSQELSEITNAKIILRAKSRIEGAGNSIDFSLRGSDMDILTSTKDIIMQRAKDIKGLIAFDNSIRSGKKEIIIKPKRGNLANTGLDVYTLAFVIRSSIEGITATKYTDKGKEYDIIVKLEETSVNSLEKIKNLPIVTPNGIFRFSQLADVEFGTTLDKIYHSDKIRAIQFTGSNTKDVALSDIVASFEELFKELNLPSGYSFSWGGDSSEMQDTAVDMLQAAIIAIILTYLLLAAILESFIQPFMILGTIPLAIIGVILSVLITGINLNIIAMMGIIMLIGIVVNAAILLLDYTHQLLREKEYSVKEALLEAAPEKLKPILMSSLAIILGMLPMALGIGDAGKEIRIGMGVVSIGGIIVSTFMTLFVIPAIYFIFSRTRKSLKNS